MNVPRHIAEKRDLLMLFLQQSVIHDPTNRIELAAGEVNKVKRQEVIIPATSWINELDRVLQHTIFNQIIEVIIQN